jgi:hypothetical protein
MQMYSSGTDIATIRRRIEDKYRASAPSMTPTPPVDGGK